MFSGPDASSFLQTWRLGKVTVNLFASETTDECDCAILEYKAYTIVADSNAVIFSRGFETLEIGNLLERTGSFHLFDHSLDAP